MPSSNAVRGRATLGLVSLSLIAFGLVAAAPAGAAPGYPVVKGSLNAYKASVEKKKCKAKKGKAKARCLRAAPGRARAATARMTRGTGRYGFNFPAAAIPARKGTLIWHDQVEPTPNAGRTDFVLYSSDAYPDTRRNIVVSGTVSIPEGGPPPGGFPVISWAHGTTGMGDSCAPSKGGDQGSYGGAEPLIQSWLDLGYAVVATDYEGLGTPGIHPYLVGDSEGRGVLDIIRASRQLFPSLSDEVVIAGHSQGAHAALFAAALAPEWAGDFSHEGTVGYAPPANLGLQASGIGSGGNGVLLFEDQYGLSALAMMILRGMAVLDPTIDPDELLMPDARAQWGATATKCLGEDPDDLPAAFAAGDIDPYDLLQQGWQATPSGQKLLAALGSANPAVVTNRELLIVQGLQDTTVQQNLTNGLVDQLVVLNPGLVEYKTYGQTIPASGGSPSFVPTNPTPGPSDHQSILADADLEVDEFFSAVFGFNR